MTKAKALELTIDQMMRPARWHWIVNSVAEFDAAEYLYLHHAATLTTKQLDRAEAILLRSGKYQVTINPEA